MKNKHPILFSILFSAMAVLSLSAQGRSYIEIRTYRCSTPEKRDALMNIFDKALIPALNRLGVPKAGVYAGSADLNKGNKEYDTLLYTLAVYPSLECYAECESKLLADTEYLKSAAEIFNAPMNDPLFDSCQSSLLCTFKKCPEVVQRAKSPDRIMQLRIYNSYNIERNAKKISMFEDGGEIQLFQNAGMPPVFFGHALSGDRLPNLTYMLSFENQEAQKEAWGKFVNSDGWKKLKAEPQYKDTANKITNIILKPSASSQL